ncbi:MAG: DUF642 domain-containing protein [Acidimicrobiales bacterium]
MAVAPSATAGATTVGWYLSLPAGSCPAPYCPVVLEVSPVSMSIGGPSGTTAPVGAGEPNVAVGLYLGKWPALSLELMRMASAQQTLAALEVEEAVITGESEVPLVDYTFAHCTISSYELGSESQGLIGLVQWDFSCQSVTAEAALPAVAGGPPSANGIYSSLWSLSFPGNACLTPGCATTLSGSVSLSVNSAGVVGSGAGGKTTVSAVAMWNASEPALFGLTAGLMRLASGQGELPSFEAELVPTPSAAPGTSPITFTLAHCKVRAWEAGSGEGVPVQATFACQSVSSGSTTMTTSNLVADGDFSQPVVSGFETFYPLAKTTLPSAVNSIQGWTVGANSVDVMGHAYWKPLPPSSPGGSQSVDLSGGAPGSVSQTVSTTAGSSYLLKWFASGNYGCGRSTKVMHVFWDSKLIASPSIDTGGPAAGKMVWFSESKVVVASSTQSVLMFADATPDKSPCGAVVADVSLTAAANP